MNEAEAGVAILLDITTMRLTELMSERTVFGELSEADIAATFVNDVRPGWDSQSGIAEKRAVFDIVENADGTVTFSVLFGSAAYGAGGLITTNQSRHSCGTLTGRFVEGTVAVADLDCPPEIKALAGEQSLAVSMTENAEKHGVQIGTSG